MGPRIGDCDMPSQVSIFDLSIDPAAKIPGMPPGMSRHAVPHALTFQSTLSSISRVYRPSDEALKDSLPNSRLMVNDPVIEECCEIRRQACCLFDWHIEPGDKRDANQVTIAGELTKMLEAIPRFIQYRENLLRATWYGRYAISHKWGWKRIGTSMRLIPVQWQPIHGDKLVFTFDDGNAEYLGDEIGIRVGLPNAEWRHRIESNATDNAPWMKNDLLKKLHDDNRRYQRREKIRATEYGWTYFLDSWERPLVAIHKHQIEDGEYEERENAGRLHGKGIRSVVYWAWLQKQEALALLMEYLERSAFGFNVFRYPMHNPEAENAIKNAALRQSESGGSRTLIFLPVPPGDDPMNYDITHIEPSGTGVDALKGIIHDYFGHMIKRYILGQTLTSEAEATGLGSELAQVHLGTFMQKLRYDAPLMDETITTDLLNLIIEYNYPEYAYAGFKFVTDTETPDSQERLEAMQKAYDMGLKIPAKDVRRLLGVGEPEADEEVLSVVENQKAMQPPPGMMMGGQAPPGENGDDAGHVPNAMPIEQESYTGGPTVSTDRERAIKSSDARPKDTDVIKELTRQLAAEFGKRGKVAA